MFMNFFSGENIKYYLIGLWRANPYQKILSAHMKAAGINVIDTDKIPSIFSILRSKRPVVLHFQFLNRHLVKNRYKCISMIIKITLLKLIGVKIFSTIHEAFNARNLSLKCYEFLLRLHERIFVFSRFSLNQIVSSCPSVSRDKFQLIPHGDMSEYYGDKVDVKEARVKLNLPLEDYIMLAFGRASDRKKYHSLYKPFILAQNKRLKLLVAGYFIQKDIDKIRETIGDSTSVIFRPEFIPDDQVRLYFSSCNAVIFNYEPCYASGVLGLALSYGKICIAPRHSYFQENLDSRKGHILFGVHSSDTLSTAIHQVSQSLLDFPDDSVRIKKTGWDTIAQIFTEPYFPQNNFRK